MAFTSCPKCGTELPENMNTCYICGCTMDNDDDDWDDEYDDDGADDGDTDQEADSEKRQEIIDEDKPNAATDDIDEEYAALLDFLSVVKYLDTLAAVYGWDTVWKIWELTKGFAENVEDVISNYPKKADVPNDEIKRCIWILRAYPNSDTIRSNIEEACDAEWWNSISEEAISEDEFDAFGHIYTVEEMRHHLQKQEWINVENACFYERVEATLQKKYD